MTVIPFRPNTVPGLRRLAADLSEREGMPLEVALDRTARASGFQGFADAVNRLYVLPDPMGPMHTTYLTGYWRRKGSTGRGTAKTELPLPLVNLVTTDFLRGNSTGHRTRLEARDHLELRRDCLLESDVDNALRMTEWGLALMAYSGLRAASAATRQRLAWIANAPMQEAWTLWECPAGGGWAYFDSVPESRQGAHMLSQIEAWVRMTAPPGTRFEVDLDCNPADAGRVRFVIASGVGMLHRVLASMDAMDRGPEPGPLQTAGYTEPFTSPARHSLASSRRHRRPARPTPCVEANRPFITGPGSAFTSHAEEVTAEAG